MENFWSFKTKQVDLCKKWKMAPNLCFERPSGEDTAENLCFSGQYITIVQSVSRYDKIFWIYSVFYKETKAAIHELPLDKFKYMNMTAIWHFLSTNNKPHLKLYGSYTYDFHILKPCAIVEIYDLRHKATSWLNNYIVIYPIQSGV